MKPRNPFYVTGYGGPKYFCDRVTELATLRAAIDNGRNVTLLAARRMGKTGLIHHLFNALADRAGNGKIKRRGSHRRDLAGGNQIFVNGRIVIRINT